MTPPIPLFPKLLIANRGEIACRIHRTCARLNIRTVAVYSDADATSLHVRLADEAIRIGPAPARESYLNIEAVIHAAKQTGATAIHPGYGFLSENDHFAEACERAGITFIGPPAAAIRAMGSKSAAKALLEAAGVPLTPGYHGDNQSPTHLHHEADRIGYPILIKAVSGGGGKGMRRVDASADFLPALASCQREAAASFNDDRVLLERYVLHPRHIEVQIFADHQGNIVSLYERDCSVQRRHQKVLEEAPAPNISSTLRTALAEAARAAARAVSYVGAGTVEFLVAPDFTFHFMEMNTRLQVEHPVTEFITGLDLVEWQIRIAAGEPVPLTQEEIPLHGHAIEARIYAEDPTHDFLPSTGLLTHLRPPTPSLHIRIDTGVDQGDAITPFYDPMIAKLIAWDETRPQALARLTRALADYQLVGVANNIPFLKRLATSPSFTQANLDTALIEREAQWLEASAPDPTTALLIAALSVLAHEQSPTPNDPWSQSDGWRLSSHLKRTLTFLHATHPHPITVEYLPAHYRMTLNSTTHTVSLTSATLPDLTATIDNHLHHATAVVSHNIHHIFLEGDHHAFPFLNPLATHTQAEAPETSLLAPMPGRIVTLLVPPGAVVAKGDPLLVLEAMKMEYTVKAPTSGRVESFLFAPGDQVAEGAQLLHFESTLEASEEPQ